MKIIITEKQLTEILGVDSSYLNIGDGGNSMINQYDSDHEVFATDKIDGDIPTPSTTDKIAKEKAPRGYFGQAKRSSLKCSIDSKKNSINEENKDLVNKTYTIPDKLYTTLKNNLMAYKGSDDNGIRRLKNLVDMRSLSTGEMYRIRNKFNNIDAKSEEYRLIGGDEMRRWIEKELKNAKSSSYSSKKTKSDLGIENAFISNHSKQGKNGMAHTRKNNNVTFTYGE